MLNQIGLGPPRYTDEVLGLPKALADIALIQLPTDRCAVLRDLTERRAQREQVVCVHHVRQVLNERHPRPQRLITKHIQGIGLLRQQTQLDLQGENKKLIDITSPLGQARTREEAMYVSHWRPVADLITLILHGLPNHLGKARHALRAHERGVAEEHKSHAASVIKTYDGLTTNMTRRKRA